MHGPSQHSMPSMAPHAVPMLCTNGKSFSQLGNTLDGPLDTCNALPLVQGFMGHPYPCPYLSHQLPRGSPMKSQKRGRRGVEGPQVPPPNWKVNTGPSATWLVGHTWPCFPVGDATCHAMPPGHATLAAWKPWMPPLRLILGFTVVD